MTAKHESILNIDVFFCAFLAIFIDIMQ